MLVDAVGFFFIEIERLDIAGQYFHHSCSATLYELIVHFVQHFHFVHSFREVFGRQLLDQLKFFIPVSVFKTESVPDLEFIAVLVVVVGSGGVDPTPLLVPASQLLLDDKVAALSECLPISGQLGPLPPEAFTILLQQVHQTGVHSTISAATVQVVEFTTVDHKAFYTAGDVNVLVLQGEHM